jgi:hypothetical protein
MRVTEQAFLRLPRAALAALLCLLSVACKMPIDTTDTLLRNQSLPLFNPHMTGFSCEVEATKVPPIDAQAEAWFLEARALEGPETVEDDRDYKKIVQLTRKAAERQHWKAMLNLASLYLEGRETGKGVEDAVQLVEEGMRLGIPAAYDRMGTYYMNATGVEGDVTRAFAFWQRAAELGSPEAMTFLADKLDATYDSPGAGFWANIPVATKMLECALSQGYGRAAVALHFLYEHPRAPNGTSMGDRTRDTKARAIKVLHEGVKLGCSNCASRLSLEFERPFNLGDMLAPYIDKARGERYGLLGDALSFDPDLRFPNLDQVLPLPPAPLPSWNGDRSMLLNAAMGVKPKPLQPKPTAASSRTDRHFLDAAFLFRYTGDKTSDDHAPRAGYWQPTGHQQPERIRAQLAKTPPGLYETGERFEHFYDPSEEGRVPIFGVVWERWDTQWHNQEAIEPRAVAGLIREVQNTAPLMACPAGRACPASGVWQPWVHSAHPLSAIVNQHWRQVWLTKGQPFPRPEQEWLFTLPERDVTWNLMDDVGVRLG